MQKSKLVDQKKKKKYSISGDDGILVKKTYRLLLLNPLRMFILEIYQSQAYYIPA